MGIKKTSKGLGSMLLKVLLFTLLLILIVFYFKTFFSYGIYFGEDNTFLKKKTLSSETYYSGSNWSGDFKIIIKGEKDAHSRAEVLFELPNNIHRRYTVTFEDASHWDYGIRNIKDSKGNIIFEGKYLQNSPFLFDKHGNPVMEEPRVLMDGESPYSAVYKVPLKTIADLAMMVNETIRGKFPLLILALFIFIYTAIDYKFPLFFFKLSNILVVRDPEPHDFYIFTQRLSWYIFPIFGLVISLIAIY
ncbi:hypothetical protein [Lederbergia graminis]|uniref:DUF6199 domain-containing protein n=1 Tax=Lederbergia graminis TaxID=735518 RepID=A0ABW0LPL3_9BACI